jgi:tryptophan-rich sensory protein
MNFASKKYLPYVLLIIPNIAVYLPTILYPVEQNVGNEVLFRPPGYVFAIVWPILLTLLGISWFVRRKLGLYLNFVYILLVLLLAIWFILYDTSKLYGLIDIIVCFVIVLYLILYNYKNIDKYGTFTLVPLLLWLSFASSLNILDIMVEILEKK